MIYEIRVYEAAEGRADAMRRRFREHAAAKFFPAHGIELVGVFTAPVEDGRLTYMTRFADEDARKKAWAGFGADAGLARGESGQRNPGSTDQEPDRLGTVAGDGRFAARLAARMKPAPFEYVRPESLAEACALLAADEDARVIAGGQTLVPMLAMRLARPARLIDILRLPELAGIRQEKDAIVVGATTRQAQAERDPVIRASVPMLARVLPWVGHPPTRNRGTIGGSIANADPSAEIPLVAVTLGAEIMLATVGRPERRCRRMISSSGRC